MRFYFILFLLLSARALLSQTPAYLHYSVPEGLPSGLVYCVEQDSRGFIWLGTDRGLVRFDGVRFRTFGVKDGLPDPEVLTIFEDSRGRLWLSCFHKKPCYLEDGKFVTAEDDSLLASIEMEVGTYAFFEDDDGSIWMTGGPRRHCLRTETSSQCFPNDIFLHVPAGKDSTQGFPYFRPLRNIHRYGGRLFGFEAGRIIEMLGNGNMKPVCELPERFSLLRSSKPDYRPHPVSIAFQPEHVLYSNRQGLLLYEFDGENFQLLDSIFNAMPGHVFADTEGAFWFNYPGHGATRYLPTKGGLYHPQHFLPGKTVTHVFRDREGNRWFSTVDDGVYLLPLGAPMSFTAAHPALHSDNFSTLAKLPDGRLVTGDNDGNLYFLEKTGWKTLPIGSLDGFNQIRQVMPIDSSHWLALSDDIVYSSRSGAFDVKAVGIINFGAAKQIVKAKGRTWLASSDYLLSWAKDPAEAKVELFARTMAVGTDSEDNVWAGGLQGLLSERDGFSVKWSDRFPALSGRIVQIKSAGDRQLWVVTPAKGLMLVSVENGTVTAVQVVNDFLKKPIENIRSLYVAADGLVWLATSQGVFSLDKKFRVDHYDTGDGLANNDVNAVLVDADTLWAATVSGLSRLVLQPPGEKIDFPTYFTGVRYELGAEQVVLDLATPLASSKHITLPDGASGVEVELTGLYFKSGNKFRYEYIIQEELLPPLQLTWGNLSNWLKHSCDTTILEGSVRNFGVSTPPGRYRMTATVILRKGGRSARSDTMTITALPHWTDTIWFSLVAFGAVVFIIAAAFRERTERRRLEYEANELQLQAIKAQINPHFVGNSINAIQQFFYPPDPVRASEYISIFTDLLRRTLLFSEKTFIPIEEELAYVRAYLEMIQLRFGDRFVFNIIGAETVAVGTPFPAMMLQPILENATIHGLSPDGISQLQIHFEVRGKRLICSVQDNGVGMNISQAHKRNMEVQRPSKGISMLRKKTEMLNRLQPIDIQLKFFDLADKMPEAHGTVVKLSFKPDEIKPNF